MNDQSFRFGVLNMARRQVLLGNYEIGGYDIMGDNLRLVGDDLAAQAEADDAPPTQMVARGGLPQSVRNAVSAQVMARGALALKETQPTKARIFPLGFESNGSILAGNSATITSRPQVLFRGERLVVPSDIAGDFTVDDVKVGKDSQFVAEGSIPARVLQENAVDVLFQLDTAQISQDITISVTNISGAPRTFRAALIGSAAE
jgi:hypothetical protein